ncbi:MAG: hypothetical protein HQK62_02555 [Desulfamplus sp.]|nr:hypothetical protein [Desulfamplus sp.]
MMPSIIEAADIGHTMYVKGAADCVVELTYGTINWTTGVIQAKGRASENRDTEKRADPSDFESARNSAKDHLVDIFKSIGLPSKYIISKLDFSLTEPVSSSTEINSSIHTIIAQIKKRAMNAKIVESHRSSRGVLEVTLMANMYGDFLQSVLPSEIRELPEIELFEPDNQYQESGLIGRTFHDNQWIKDTGMMIQSGKDKDRYTGIIIDARGIKFKPVICPIVVNEQGEEIYSPTFISRKYAVERGVCSYICSLEPEATSRKIGNNPIMIKGLRRDGDKNNTIVVSMSDADKLQRMPERHLLMKGCRVVIVISE